MLLKKLWNIQIIICSENIPEVTAFIYRLNICQKSTVLLGWWKAGPPCASKTCLSVWGGSSITWCCQSQRESAVKPTIPPDFKKKLANFSAPVTGVLIQPWTRDTRTSIRSTCHLTSFCSSPTQVVASCLSSGKGCIGKYIHYSLIRAASIICAKSAFCHLSNSFLS